MLFCKLSRYTVCIVVLLQWRQDDFEHMIFPQEIISQIDADSAGWGGGWLIGFGSIIIMVGVLLIMVIKEKDGCLLLCL